MDGKMTELSLALEHTKQVESARCCMKSVACCVFVVYVVWNTRETINLQKDVRRLKFQVENLMHQKKYVSDVIDMSTPTDLKYDEEESYSSEKNAGYSLRFKRQATNCTCKCAKKKNKCRGKRGKRGFKGFKGIQGQKGEQGIPGMVGPPGRPGFKGDRGSPGHQGQNGMPGRDGSQGLRGEQGQKGAAGPIGRPGGKGEKGEKGQRGVPGTNGIPGNQGYPGVKGDKGNAGRPGLNAENWAAHLEQRGHLSSTGHRNDPFIKTWNGRYYTKNNVYENIVSNQILGFLQNSSLPSDVKSPVEYQRNGTHRVLLDGLYLLYMNIMTTAEMHIGLYIDVNIGLLCHTSSSVSVKQSGDCKECLQHIANVKSCSTMGLFHIKKGQHIYLKISEGRKSVFVQDTNFGVLLLLTT